MPSARNWLILDWISLSWSQQGWQVSPLLMTSHHFHGAAGHIPPSTLSPTARSARPAPFVNSTGDCLSLRHDRGRGALDLSDLASDDLLLGLHAQQARS